MRKVILRQAQDEGSGLGLKSLNTLSPFILSPSKDDSGRMDATRRKKKPPTVSYRKPAKHSASPDFRAEQGHVGQ
jgi:hypothetical protein